MTSRLSGASREYTLSLYKQLLSSSKRLPKGKQREDAITDVKRRFRENLHVSDHLKAKELIRDAESRLGFLRMVTPRGTFANAGATRVVYRDGKVIEGAEARKREKARHSNWDGRNLDPDSVRHHKQNLARAGFADHQQVIGPHGF